MQVNIKDDMHGNIIFFLIGTVPGEMTHESMVKAKHKSPAPSAFVCVCACVCIRYVYIEREFAFYLSKSRRCTDLSIFV